MDYGLRGKNALITGSTCGIGKAAAEILASEGANVVVTGIATDKQEEQAEYVAAQLEKNYHVKSVGLTCNLFDENAPEKLFADALGALGSLDILVNSAGIWPTAYVTEMEKDEFEKTVYFNLEIPYILCRLMANHLIDNDKKGKIVNVTSQAAFHGSTTGHAHYAASKAGLVTFMISQAREVAKHGININAVAPGIVRTNMTAENLKKDPDYYLNRIPVGRVAEPEDVAKVIAFLTSTQADYLTGITVDATGGMLMR